MTGDQEGVEARVAGDVVSSSDNEGWELLFQGAESRVWTGKYEGVEAIKKERFRKEYRHPEMDKLLLRQRQRAEVRAMQRLKEKNEAIGKLIPTVLKTTERDIIMTRVTDAETVCDYIRRSSLSDDQMKSLLKDIGRLIAEMHKIQLIHGDLTTSNFLINSKKCLIPIDFGLSSVSTSVEDRAVDLYVLERAMNSSHHVDESLFHHIVESYVEAMGSEGPKVQSRLEQVRLRGRKRTMVG